jgi:hypothetical protein
MAHGTNELTTCFFKKHNGEINSAQELFDHTMYLCKTVPIFQDSIEGISTIGA